MSIRAGSRSCAATQTVTDRSAIHRAPARSGIDNRDVVGPHEVRAWTGASISATGRAGARVS